MKKLFVLIIGLLVLSSLAIKTSFADTVVLDNPETLSNPTSQNLRWKITLIDAETKTMVVSYYWRDDATGDPLYFGRRSQWKTWSCRDIEVEGTNAECTDVEVPWACCTGAGTGTCDDMISTCFSDVFKFLIRAQDVDTMIGVGLRTLIWNKFKADVLTGGNDGTFEQ